MSKIIPLRISVNNLSLTKTVKQDIIFTFSLSESESECVLKPPSDGYSGLEDYSLSSHEYGPPTPSFF